MNEQEYLAKPPVLPDRVTHGERVDKAVKQAAGVNYGLADDSLAGYIYEQHAKGKWSQDDVNTALEAHSEAMEVSTKGAGAAAVSAAADITAFATTLLYNSYNISQGHSWAWPEDMRNVPATSEWWGEQLGLTKEQTDSLAFIGGGLAIAPSRALDNLDGKAVAKAIKLSKALGGGRRSTAVLKRAEAARLYEQGAYTDNEIWQATGWFPYKGDEGLGVTWKFFISDADAKYNHRAPAQAADRIANGVLGGVETLSIGDRIQVPMRMGEVLDHPALYQLYPELEGYPISVMMQRTADGWSLPENAGGHLASWNPAERKFTLASHRGSHYTAATPEDAVQMSARQSLLHEAQHAIQTLEGWEDGANASAMAEAVGVYKAGRLMSDVYANPEAFASMQPEEVATLVMDVGFPRDELVVFAREIGRVIDGTLSPEEIAMQTSMWAGVLQDGLAKSERWLSTAVYMGDDKLDFIKNLDSQTLDGLSWMTYQLNLGEMEARLTESLSNISQMDINALPMTPHNVMERMQGTRTYRYLKHRYPGISRMEGAAPIKHAITGASEAVLDTYGLRAQDAGTMTSEDLGQMLQKLIDTDPELGFKVLKEIPSDDVEGYDALLKKVSK